VGFFTILKRLANGEEPFQMEEPKPVDALGSDGKPNSGSMESGFGTPRDAEGLKILPRVSIDRIECRVNGASMQCFGVLDNYSDFRIELDRIILLGTQKKFDEDTFLEPHKQKEYLLYSGPTASNESNIDCELYYKNESEDYFNAHHVVDFSLNSDGTTYIFDTITFEPPVRDIYE